MAMMIFYEETNPSQWTVACLEAGAIQWKETVEKKTLCPWLEEKRRQGALKKEDRLLLVLPEPQVVRVLVELPPRLSARERRAMAENAMLLQNGEKHALVTLRALAGAAPSWVAMGLRQSDYERLRHLFGKDASRLEWVPAADCRLAMQIVPPEDGYYAMEAPLWTAVVAIKDGHVIGSRAGQGQNATVLQMALQESLDGIDLPPFLHPWQQEGTAQWDEAALKDACLKKAPAVSLSALQGKGTWVALIVGCIVLPGFIWLAALGRTVPAEEATSQTLSNTVTRSTYSTLLDRAYSQKSDRVVLLSHEAAEGALAIQGRCSEALDIAAYMRALEESDVALHPLLLDLAKKNDKDRYYYEFVVQISLEGRADS